MCAQFESPFFNFVVTLAEAAAMRCVWELIAPVDLRSLPGDHSGQSANPAVIP